MSLRRIADSLNVSITTVSRALAGYSDVAPATRERIRREAERIGYVPNEVARRLQKGRSDAFGLVIPGGPPAFEDPFFLATIAGAWSRLSELDLELIVLSSTIGPQEERVYRRLAEGRRVDGLILTRIRDDDPRIAYLRSINFPFVAFGGSVAGADVPYVEIDASEAVDRMVERLVGFGHRRILCLGSDTAYRFAVSRVDAFRIAADRHGIRGDVRLAPLTEQGGLAVVGPALAEDDPPTAILTITERPAIGALQAIRSHGLVPGTDVSVISFGDSALSQYCVPPLTVMKIPTQEMAEHAVDVLVGLRDGFPIEPIRSWQAELVVRASDGPAPGSSGSADRGRPADRSRPTIATTREAS